MRKTLNWALTAALTVAVVSGCSNQTGGAVTPSKDVAAPAEKTTTAPLKENTFTFLDYSNASWPYNKDWPVWKYIKEKTGVTLNVSFPPDALLDNALNLTVASGNMPDLLYTQSKKTADKFGQQGALVNILDHINEMPNLKKWMVQFPADTQNAISADGKMYVFPNHGIGETNRMNWMYREDVFKKNGLKTPANWDELYTVLKTLKQAYPDSYPMAWRQGLLYLRNFAPAFSTGSDDSANDVYFDSDKKEWRYGPIEDNFKKMITYLNKFYKEGLIPPDFLTIDTKQWQDLMSTDRSFVTADYISRVDFYNLPMRKQNPSYNLLFMPTPAGWPGGPQKNAYTQFLENGLMVTSTSKNIKDIMHFMDFFYTKEGLDLVSWGKQGETYSEENGKKKFIGNYADVSDMRKKTGLSTDGTYTWFDYDAHLSLSSPELQDAYKQAVNYDSQQQPRPALTQQELEVISTTGQTLLKTRDQALAKFITGQRDLNEWNSYVDELKKIGVDKVVNVYKAAYDRSQVAKK
ncbi:extracellular solute-binding protein [Paenibacillus alginolyticus]|uniref:extracellular solute-binding protein n=1 Tax=Paenibacillus alginolyticus TaxID=59839 RepID=UPI000422B122|nr:extracellular solute-binding protein [Paenibacillus alginolyticus]MCY9670232.1 extracellular solute-binding protein [Paenibacillus alginolyticus]